VKKTDGVVKGSEKKKEQKPNGLKRRPTRGGSAITRGLGTSSEMCEGGKGREKKKVER